MGWHYTRLLPNFLRRNPLILLKNNRKKALFCSLGFAMYVKNSEIVPYTNRRHLVLYPSLVEQDSIECWIELRKSGKFAGKAILPPSHPDDIRVQKIAKDIFEATRRELRKDRHKRAQTAHVEEFNLEVFVVDDPSKDNASCYPGGKIVVYTGLLRAAESDAEIAVVIGHEIGHVIARYGVERDYLAHLVDFFLEAYKSVVVCEILHNFLKRSRLSRSRRNEREADYIGLFLSASAGYDPRAALQRWKRHAELMKNRPKTVEHLYSHPPPEERAKLLSCPKVMVEALSIYKKALSQSDS